MKTRIKRFDKSLPLPEHKTEKAKETKLEYETDAEDEIKQKHHVK